MAANDARATEGRSPAGHQFVIAQVLDAPRERIFGAWSKAERLAPWQGAPRGFALTTERSDLRGGGGFENCTRPPEGYEPSLRQSLVETARSKRLALGLPRLVADTEPIPERIVAVTVVECGKKTDKYGWMGAFDELAEYLGRLS